MTRKLSQVLDSLVFLLLFFFFANQRRRIPAVSPIKLKFTEHAQTKCASTHWRYMYDLIAIFESCRSGGLRRERNWY